MPLFQLFIQSNVNGLQRGEVDFKLKQKDSQ